MKTKHLSSKFLTVGSLLAATVILLGLGQNASAQWSPTASPTPTPGTNIYYNSGNVGIGTTSPEQKLSVNGAINIQDRAAIDSPANERLRLLSNYKISTDRSWDNTKPTWLGDFGLNDGFSVFRAPATSGSPAFTNLFLINSSGNVGIGTTSPGAKVHIRVDNYESIWFDRSANTNSPTIFSMGITYDTPNNEYFRIGHRSGGAGLHDFVLSKTGNVGVGTTSPNPLAVSASTYGRVLTIATPTAAARPVLEFWTNAAPSDGQIIGQINFLSGTSPTSGPAAAILSASNGTAANTGDLRFLTSSASGTPVTRMFIDASGNTNVTGDLNVTGNIKAKFQDVAEWVPASVPVPVGTVVVLDSTKPNQVTSSTVSYDTRVAGVVSAQPGIALGESGAGKVLVATTGRVMVKVDASRGPIHIGDLLVTSDLPGVAMKSEPVDLGGVKLHRPGTLIGKALEPLEKGSGKILVLLSLQ